MRLSRLGWGIAGIVWVVGGAAHAAGGPALMVAVEVEAGGDLGAEEVRRAIAAELHRPVVAPAAASTVDAPDVLLVSVGHGRIVVSFRASSDERASRGIAAPAEHGARLRAIAWLAGNLARDQVSPLLLEAAATPAAAPASTKPEPATAQTEPPAVPPPPLERVEPAQNDDALELRAAPAERSADDPTWTVTVTGGPSLQYSTVYGAEPWRGAKAGAWQGEVQRRRLGGWLLGAAIDWGPTPDHRVGYAVTGGLEQRWRGFRLEETLGLGVGSTNFHVESTQTNSSLTGESSTTTVSASPVFTPYARAFATLSHPVARSWDVVLRVGAHSDLAGTLESVFVASSIGVRLRLP